MTAQQLVFVEEYARSGNATKAAEIADYRDANVAGTRLLMRPEIMEAVTKLRRIAYARDSIELQDVLTELGAVAFSDPLELFDADGNLREMKDIPKALRVAITGFDVEYEKSKIVKDTDAEADTLITRVTGMKKIKLAGKVEALKALLQFIGGKPETVTNIVNNNTVVVAETSKLIDALRNRRASIEQDAPQGV